MILKHGSRFNLSSLQQLKNRVSKTAVLKTFINFKTMKQIRFKVHSICVFLMFLLMIPFGAFAQQGMVTGQVVDEKGERGLL